jgi:hypothetical protein
MFQDTKSEQSIQTQKSSLLSDGLARITASLESAKDNQGVHEAVYFMRQLALSTSLSLEISLLKT